jgi:putative oxidoreductase
MEAGTALPRVGEPAHDLGEDSAWTRYLVPVGRILFAATHVVFSPLNFSREAVTMAGQAGVPLSGLLVPLAAVISFAGGLSIILGYRAKVGAWLLILFLVPVTFYMHNF